MSVVSWRRMASDLTDQVRELQKERDELLAEVERLRRPFKLYDSSEMTNRIARLTARVQVTEAKLIDTSELYERMKQRAEAAEAKVLQLGIEKDAEEYRANVAEAERDRLAWMLERIRDSEYDRMSDADALADLAARYDARHEDGDG